MACLFLHFKGEKIISADFFIVLVMIKRESQASVDLVYFGYIFPVPILHCLYAYSDMLYSQGQGHAGPQFLQKTSHNMFFH